jgi:hypothetical protein
MTPHEASEAHRHHIREDAKLSPMVGLVYLAPKENFKMKTQKIIALAIVGLSLAGCGKPQPKSEMTFEQLSNILVERGILGTTNWIIIQGHATAVWDNIIWTNSIGTKVFGITPTGWFFKCKF